MRLNLSNYNLVQSNNSPNNVTITNQPTATISRSSSTNTHQLPTTSQIDSSNTHHHHSQQQHHHHDERGFVTKSTDSLDPPDSSESASSKPINRNSSLISFKSLDFNLKTIYTNLKHKHRDQGNISSTARTTSPGCGSSSPGGSKNDTTSSSKTSVSRTPYVRVETVDQDESNENLLLHYHSSPYSHRGSFDKSSSGSQYLTATGGGCGQYPDYNSRSQATTPSSFLTISSPPNVRRSSTSDICESKKTLATSISQPSSGPDASGSRRPSTSDLLRRARERKSGADTKMGRSISHGGMPRGGRGGRRTSMAF